MPEARIDGVNIHYDEAGEGEPLLLIMGYGMPGDAWLGSLPFLGGFRCVYFDNRGTGRSDKPDGPYTIDRMAEDAAGLLDHLGIARTHVYGVSMGGMIAQELALRHPEKIRSLALGCTLCGGEHSTMAEPQIIEELIDVMIDVVPAGTSVELPGADIVLREKTILGCMMGSNRFRTDMPRYIELYRSGSLRLDEMICARLPLEGVNDALDALRRGTAARSVIVFASGD